MTKLQLQGFNNLTKSLNFNLYFLFSPEDFTAESFDFFLEQNYGSHQLQNLLNNLSELIDAHILTLSSQAYDPHGASATCLVAEKPHLPLRPYQVLGHLDKSHLAAHTYPEFDPEKGIALLRMDLDIVTCGVILPLIAIDYLLRELAPHVCHMDYRVRGVTPDASGEWLKTDHPLPHLPELLSPDMREKYKFHEQHLPNANCYYASLICSEILTSQQAEPAKVIYSLYM